MTNERPHAPHNVPPLHSHHNTSLTTQDLYGVRSDLGNLFKALGRLEDAKVRYFNLPTTVS